MSSSSASSRRQKRRSRGHGSRTQHVQPHAGWELQHSPFTVEGRIEGAQRFAMGARHQTGWKRRVLIGVALLFPVCIGLALFVELVTAVVGWMR